MRELLIQLIDSARPSRTFILPSKWCTDKRSLSAAYSKRHGAWDWRWSPYFKELLDNFAPDGPVQFSALMKPVQIGATQSVLEPVIGYTIDVCPRTIGYATADKELAETNIDTRIDSMIDSCQIGHKIKPITYKKLSRKTGDTRSKKEYEGGELHAIGAQNPNKFRQFSAPILLGDEVDGWPIVTKHGCPVELYMARSDAFDDDRKMLFMSSPLLAATSHIYRLIQLGDKRYFIVPCPRCGVFQALFWRGGLIDNKYVNDGVHNIIYETDDNGILFPESIYYKCRECSGKIYDYEKFDMINEGEWHPTQKPSQLNWRSYLLNNTYNLMKSWKSMCNKFLVTKKDPKKLMVFVNNECGEPWEDIVHSVSHKKIFNEKRREISTLIVPNKAAIADLNGPILVLICSVDVNKKDSWLGVEIIGHCIAGQEYVIAKGRIHGSLDKDGNAWQALEYIIDSKYLSDDKIEYEIALTAIDCGYKRNEVFHFINAHPFCVPVRGREKLSGSKKHHKVIIDGIKIFNIDTRYYKIQLFEYLNLMWEGRPQIQPPNFPNYPDDIYNGGFEKMNLGEQFGVGISGNGFDEDFFKTYESEVPIYVDLPDGSKAVKGFKKRTPNNHFLDTHVYNLAAIEIYIRIICDVWDVPRMDKWSMMAEFNRFFSENNVPFLLEYFEL